MATLPPLVPLFPIPEHVFLPAVPHPYRVFEPRYVALVEHLLKRPADERWLCIPRLARADRDDPSPPPAFARVATLGRLEQCRRLPRGHYLVIVRGESRVRLTEAPSDHPFRLARPEPWPDVERPPGPNELEARLLTLEQLLVSLSRYLGPEGQDLVQLLDRRDDAERGVYRLAAALLPSPDAAQRLLETRSLSGRISALEDALAGALAAVEHGKDGRPAFPRS